MCVRQTHCNNNFFPEDREMTVENGSFPHRVPNEIPALEQCSLDWNQALWEFFVCEIDAYEPEDIAEAQRDFERCKQFDEYLFG
jgi:predicted metal-dependent peptidase